MGHDILTLIKGGPWSRKLGFQYEKGRLEISIKKPYKLSRTLFTHCLPSLSFSIIDDNKSSIIFYKVEIENNSKQWVNKVRESL